ncbi:MAG TPA: hypothetical protein PKD27_00170 [Tepidiformaceae bacterium]|nr:hypothetical protein [Tepidiformaceae bacterium]
MGHKAVRALVGFACAASLFSCGDDSSLREFEGEWQRVGNSAFSAESWEGDAHCELDGAVNLRLSHQSFDTFRNFVRDPDGKSFFRLQAGQPPLDAFIIVPELPGDAFPAGLRNGGPELFLVPGMAAVYVRIDDKFERWPSAPYDLSCD